MTEGELSLLTPVFTRGERYLNGMTINWADVDYLTASQLKILRMHLGKPVRLIWNVYHRKTDRIDATFPSVPLGQVFLGLTRLPQCSWGLYEGRSLHLDTREFETVPARWMAIKPENEHLLKLRKLDHLITGRTEEWIYLQWNHPDSFAALSLVIHLAETSGAANGSG